MKKNIMIINADHDAAQIVKNNLTCPSTNILCVSSMHEALLSFMDKEFCLVILDACISAEDDHKLLRAIRKARTTPILILLSCGAAGRAASRCPCLHRPPLFAGGMSCPGTVAHAALLRPQTAEGGLLYAGFWQKSHYRPACKASTAQRQKSAIHPQRVRLAVLPCKQSRTGIQSGAVIQPSVGRALGLQCG